MTPNARPQSSATISRAVATAGPKPTSAARGRSVGASASSSRVPHQVPTAPSPPPRMASTNVSVTSCRATRGCRAPSARRTANSRCRSLTRAESRPATLAQAINSTATTAPNSSQSPRSTGAAAWAFRSTTSTPIAIPKSARLSTSRTIDRTLSSAAGREVPSRSRPTTARFWVPKFCRSWPDQVRGIQNSERVPKARPRGSSAPLGKPNPRGMTPTTSARSDPTPIALPMICGSAPNRARQRPSLRITTLGPPSLPSLSRNTRPTCGVTPRIGNNEGVTRAPRTCSRSFPSPMVSDHDRNAASPLKLRFSVFTTS